MNAASAIPVGSAPSKPGVGIAGAILGNALEWYDFTIYAYMTPIISSVFFPVDPHRPETQLNAVLATTAVFGVGFFMRPVGGIVLGLMGDRYGRRRAMVLGMALMAVGTLLLTCAPSYQRVGLLAPVLVVLARLIQGFSLGGQFGTSTAYLIEMAPPGKAGLYGSWQITGQVASLVVGTSFGFALTQFFTPAELAHGIWRLPFAFGLVIAPAAWYLRRHVAESQVFLAARGRAGDLRSGPQPSIGGALLGLRGQLLASIGMVAASAVSFYAVYGYTVTYSRNVLHLPLRDSFFAEMLAATLMLGVVPAGGMLADRFNRRRLLLWFLGAYFVLMYPLYAWLVAAPSISRLVTVQLLISLVSGLFLGVYCTTMSELFPARVRSTGLSIANNCAVLVFGGFAQFILTWIFKLTGSPMAPVYYVMLGVAFGLAGAALMPDRPAAGTRGTD
jgi:MFS family permease